MAGSNAPGPPARPVTATPRPLHLAARSPGRGALCDFGVRTDILRKVLLPPVRRELLHVGRARCASSPRSAAYGRRSPSTTALLGRRALPGGVVSRRSRGCDAWPPNITTSARITEARGSLRCLCCVPSLVCSRRLALTPLRHACRLRAWRPGRSPRHASCVGSMDSDPCASLISTRMQRSRRRSRPSAVCWLR